MKNCKLDCMSQFEYNKFTTLETRM